MDVVCVTETSVRNANFEVLMVSLYVTEFSQVFTTETSVNLYQITRRHVSEDYIVHNRNHENFKCAIVF